MSHRFETYLEQTVFARDSQTTKPKATVNMFVNKLLNITDILICTNVIVNC